MTARVRRRRRQSAQRVRQQTNRLPWWSGLVVAASIMAGVIAIGLLGVRWWQQQFQARVSSQVMAFVSSDPNAISPVVLLRVTAGQRQPEVWLVPPEAVVTVAGGYGQYPLRSLAPVVLLDGRPPAQVRLALSLALGRLVDQVWIVPGNTWPAAPLWRQLTTAQTAPALPWWQRRQWQQWLRSWGEPTAQVLPALPTAAEWQSWQPPLIRSCPLAVVNATTNSGLATWLSQLLEQSGVFVIRVTDTSDTRSASQLIVRPESEAACKPVVSILELLFSEADLTITPDAQQADRFRAEAVFVIGSDVAETGFGVGEE